MVMTLIASPPCSPKTENGSSKVWGDVRGQGAIREHCKNLSKGILWSQHDIFAPRVEISDQGDRAVAHFNLVCLLTMRSDVADAKGEAFLLAGNYTDHLVKVDGEWLS